jgi:hypothetical protein
MFLDFSRDNLLCLAGFSNCSHAGLVLLAAYAAY